MREHSGKMENCIKFIRREDLLEKFPVSDIALEADEFLILEFTVTKIDINYRVALADHITGHDLTEET